MARKCQECPDKESCKNKRMEALAYIIPEPIAAPAMAELTAPLMADILVKHDYRNIKIDADTTITIDLEDLKKEITRSLYKDFDIWRGLNYGA